ncbi:thioesterase [Segetibacter sp. 3557_3]|uniref:acyl-CoA thioesterase n=1 Tax=Segetibacter sp. 3557_3 TaxID=2547429 RepID=UPI001058B70C|nr:thioesterase family protein [Segetibacter sp. 3557_3]TDH26822.1 thioesterase [Segetibacter sp. 3557_3]
MERIKLNLADEFSYTTALTIRITDLNYGGHVGNDTFLALIHEARQQFLAHHGYEELSFEGAGLIMADVAIEFKHELHYADRIRISVAATGFDKFGFDLHYLLELDKDGGLVSAAKAKTGMLCYDYASKKLMKLPEAAVLKLNNR